MPSIRQRNKTGSPTNKYMSLSFSRIKGDEPSPISVDNRLSLRESVNDLNDGCCLIKNKLSIDGEGEWLIRLDCLLSVDLSEPNRDNEPR